MNGLALIRCPYCTTLFDERYYMAYHVPCPTNKGDKRAHVGTPGDDKNNRGPAEEQAREGTG
jgi:uncharacterized C2H2 Zn-finger protein